MIPAIRSQADDLGDEYSDAAGFDTGTETLTRQEFTDEANINTILERFGVDTLTRANPTYGQDIDYTMDLQQAIMAAHLVEQAQQQIPEELKSTYKDWITLIQGAQSGAYRRDLEALELRKKAEAAKANEAASAISNTTN